MRLVIYSHQERERESCMFQRERYTRDLFYPPGRSARETCVCVRFATETLPACHASVWFHAGILRTCLHACQLLRGKAAQLSVLPRESSA